MKNRTRRILSIVTAFFAAAVLVMTPTAVIPVQAATASATAATASASVPATAAAILPGQDPTTLAYLASLSQIAASRGLTRKYAGKTLSILGDSISTLGGTMPEGYLSYYPAGGIGTVNQTWWGSVMSATGMKLLNNCSWSGARMQGSINDPSGKTGCSLKRVSDLSSNGVAPDVVFIMMGANDLFNSVEISSFKASYDTCLNEIRAAYPMTQIICFTCLPAISGASGTNCWNDKKQTIADYNAAIIQSAAEHGVQVVDTYSCGINCSNYKDLTTDGGGVHPNQLGAYYVARYIVSAMQ